MGLIIEEALPQVTTLVSTPVAQVTYTRVCTDGSSSSGVTDSKSFDKTIYRVFSMQDNMKTLQEPGKVRNEFELFVKYAISKTNGTMYDSRFDQLDTYLGSLGTINEVC